MKYMAFSLDARDNGFGRPIAHRPVLQEIGFTSEQEPAPGQIVDLGNGILASIRHWKSIESLVLILPDKSMYCIEPYEYFVDRGNTIA
jgi:hypothetical protein